MRTHGDDVAEVLALLGARPLWQKENRRVLGCEVVRAHLHVVRREDNENLAVSKRRRELVVPVHPAVMLKNVEKCLGSAWGMPVLLETA